MWRHVAVSLSDRHALLFEFVCHIKY
jgi:hypothetical protein